MRKLPKGFTLIELLVVVSIIGVLSVISFATFNNAQTRARDAQKKSDLQNIAKAVEIFYSDYQIYPDGNAGKIVGCPYSTSGVSAVCMWGEGRFTDGKTTYFEVLPSPTSGGDYYYRTLSGRTKFQIFTHLENSEDQNCIDNNCSVSAVDPAVSCGDGICNFAVTSANTSPKEQISNE